MIRAEQLILRCIRRIPANRAAAQFAGGKKQGTNSQKVPEAKR